MEMHTKVIAFWLGVGAAVGGAQAPLLSGGDVPEVAWSQVIDAPGTNWLRSLARDAEDNFIAAGAKYGSDSSLASDVYVAKLSGSGEVLWKTVIDYHLGDEGFGVGVNKSGYIIVGASGGDGPCGLDCIGFREAPDIYVAQLNDSGEIVWQSRFGGADIDAGRAVVSTSSGEAVIVGQTRSFGSGLDDVIVLKVDSSGQLLWQKTFGGTKQDIGYAIVATDTSGFLIVGKSWSFSEWSALYILSIDEAGELLWEKTIAETTATRSGRAVINVSSGGYAIGGTRENAGQVTMIDANGVVLWERTLASPAEINDIIQGDDGMLVAAGTKVKNASDFDVYIARMDAHGVTAQDVLYGSEGKNERMFAISGDKTGSCILAGDAQDDSYVAKLVIKDRPFLRGDSDGNEDISISDSIAIVSFLFQGGEALLCLDAADANDDARVNVVDAIVIIMFLFQGGAGLSEPIHHLGIDPTPDELWCPKR